jgi:hypothetical protein
LQEACQKWLSCFLLIINGLIEFWERYSAANAAVTGGVLLHLQQGGRFLLSLSPASAGMVSVLIP